MTSKQKISAQMKKIHSKDTKPEIMLRHALWQEGIRYRKNYIGLPGKPDIAILSSKIAIFVDGEFWHGYDLKNEEKRLHHNKKYWIKKIKNNMKRDKKINQELMDIGWHVIRYPAKYVMRYTDECTTEVIQEIAILKQEHTN